MKELNSYITEKLHLDKDTEIEKRDFKYFVKELDNAFKSELTDDDYKRTSNLDDKEINYFICFSNGSKWLKIKFEIFDSTKDGILLYGMLHYNNGKYSPSIRTNPNVNYNYIFKYGEKVTSGVIALGGHAWFQCTEDRINKIIKGLQEFYWHKHEFDEAIKKERFTTVQWNKLVKICKDLFEDE